jgi:hypothetical protein
MTRPRSRALRRDTPHSHAECCTTSARGLARGGVGRQGLQLLTGWPECTPHAPYTQLVAQESDGMDLLGGACSRLGTRRPAPQQVRRLHERCEASPPCPAHFSQSPRGRSGWAGQGPWQHEPGEPCGRLGARCKACRGSGWAHSRAAAPCLTAPRIRDTCVQCVCGAMRPKRFPQASLDALSGASRAR